MQPVVHQLSFSAYKLPSKHGFGPSVNLNTVSHKIRSVLPFNLTSRAPPIFRRSKFHEVIQLCRESLELAIITPVLKSLSYTSIKSSSVLRLLVRSGIRNKIVGPSRGPTEFSKAASVPKRVFVKTILRQGPLQSRAAHLPHRIQRRRDDPGS